MLAILGAMLAIIAAVCHHTHLPAILRSVEEQCFNLDNHLSHIADACLFLLEITLDGGGYFNCFRSSACCRHSNQGGMAVLAAVRSCLQDGLPK